MTETNTSDDPIATPFLIKYLRHIRGKYRYFKDIIQSELLRLPLIPPDWICFREFDPRIYYVFDDRQLVYLEVPKTASTSTLYAIGQAYQLNFKSGQIHLNPFWHIERGQLQKSQMAYHKFTFVRNPFARLVSCYKEKVVKMRHHQGYNYFDKAHFFIPLEVTFAEFVRIVSDIPDCVAERHFKSQAAILYHKGQCLVDQIGRFEDLAATWADIAATYHFEPRLQRLTASHHISNTQADYRCYYTPELVELVKVRYQQDITLFGYEADYQALLNFVEFKS